MNMRRSEGILLSAVSPKFLHANSTSHTWPFSAVAELIDNAYDPDVMAKQFWIDWTQIKEFDCLTFQDNGRGMTKSRMYEMLSLGFSDKQTVRGHTPVGQYGNGFKSSSMRLGKDAIIFSKIRDTMSVGLLSQSYLESIQAKHVVVPIVTIGHDGQCPHEDAASLQDILKHSLFNTAEELLTELRAITSVSSTGTRIIIWNLRRVANGETEFDLSTDRYDIRIPLDACETHKNQNVAQSVPEIIYSLRAYCSILYLKPRMQIIIRGQKVKTQLISKSLALTRKDQYKPVFLKERIPITFGYNIRSKDEYGMMMYHKNRLIKAFERVGCQRKGGFRGVGVIGVIECDFLQPTHNKQDFDDTEEYRKIMNNLAKKLEEYWDEIQLKRKGCSVPAEDAVKHPDQNWVQCDDCQKWRRLPDGIDSGRLPDKWFCRLNPDPQYRSCQTEEEPEDSEDVQQCDPKPYKRLSSVKVSAVAYRNDLINFLAHLHRHIKGLLDPMVQSPCRKKMAKMQKKDQQQMPAPVLPLPTAPALPLPTAPALPLPATPLSGSEWWRPAEGAPTGLSSESFTHPSWSGQNLPNDTMLMDCEDHVPRTPGREKNSKMQQKKIRQQVPAPALPLSATPLSDSEWWRPAEGAPTGLSSESFTHPSCSGHYLSHDTMLMDCEDHVSITPERVKQVVPQTVGVSPINTKTMELTTPSVPPGCIQKTIKKQEKIQWESLVEEAFKNKGVGKVLEGNRPRSPMLKVQQQPDGLQDTYKEQVNQLQQELEEMKNRCGHLQETEKEVQRRLKDMEIENCSLSCQCEQLNIFHEESCRKLRNLRQRIGRLLVTFLPTLDLEEINLDSDVMDKILDKVLNEVTEF